MENQNAPILYPTVGIKQLVARQLADWQRFLIELETTNTPEQDLAYCRQQVERLQKQLSDLTAQQ